MSELELPVGSLVLTDLHVDPADPVAVEELGRLLAACADAPVLLCLGDLFEYWLGPAQARGDGRVVLDLLASFPGRLHLVPGNRDVLAGDELAEVLGGPLLWEGARATLPDGTRALFLHGDELCLADRGYQRLRRVLRAPLPRALLRGLPGPVGHALARRLRRRSVSAVAAKAPLEVAQDPVEAARRLDAAGAGLLVCGHTHAFRDLALDGAGGPGRAGDDGGRLVVLDALGGGRDLARVTPTGLDFCASSSLLAGAAG